MPRLTHPATGRTITRSESQAAFYRRRGWVDEPAPSTSMRKDELIERAEAEGVRVDPSATKAEIVEELS